MGSIIEAPTTVVYLRVEGITLTAAQPTQVESMA
jgi:hypothetical protein